MRFNQAILGLGVLAGGCAAGCQIVIDVGDWIVVETDTTAGGGTAGSGGSGGSGGAPVCAPGESQSCYSGPPGTVEVGACHAGVQTCTKEATGFGLCEKQALPTQELCASPADENCDGHDCGMWASIFGDGSTAEVQDVDVDAQGNTIVVGRFSKPIDFGGVLLTSMGSDDLFVAKFDPTGKHLWSKSYGDAASQNQIRAAVDPTGNILLAGVFAGQISFGVETLYAKSGGLDVFTAKLTPEGGAAWARKWGEGSELDVDVAVDGFGDPVLVGRFFSNIKFVTILSAEGAGSVFVAKLAGSNGTAIWGFSYAEGIETRNAIATDLAGNVYVLGGVGPFPTVPQISCTAGTYVAKFSPVGASTWTTCLIAGPGNAPAIAVDTAQNAFFATGDGNNLGKLDVAGELAWQKDYVPAFSEHPSSRVAVAPSGDVVLAIAADGQLDLGGGKLKSSGLEDIFLARYTTDGGHLWSKVYGDAGSQRGPFMAVAPDETVAIGCTIDGKIDFGTGALVSAGSGVVVARLGR